MSYFEIYQEAQGNYRWLFRANNGQILARSEEGFLNQLNCERSILLLKQQSPKAALRVALQGNNQVQQGGAP
jgi:uncharacterized protein YegP (UPF0339 family)